MLWVPDANPLPGGIEIRIRPSCTLSVLPSFLLQPTLLLFPLPVLLLFFHLTDLCGVAQSGAEWLEMKHLWGANWAFIGGPLRGPFSVKLTSLSTQQTLSARDVIPRNWSPKATYTSRLNFI